MRESKVEKYLKDRVEEIGGLTRKLQWGMCRNAPDQFVAYKGTIALVEVKATGKKPRAAQRREHVRLKNCGVNVGVVDSYEAVDRLIQAFKAEDRNREAYSDMATIDEEGEYHGG